MKKNKKGNLLLFLLVGVVTLGIGYAAISNISLSINGNAQATGSKEDTDWNVRFVKSTDTESSIAEVAAAAENATSYEVSSGSSATAEASITDDTTATFSVENMVENDMVTFTYYIANLSNDIKAKINVPTITNDKTDYFEVTASPIVETTLNDGKVQEVTVTVRCLQQTKLENTASFTVSFTAEPINE